MITLSPRLAAVAEYVLVGRPMADIGTDHAYLPAYLVQAGIVPGAIAADVLPGPLDAARSTVAAEGLTEHIALRLGNGLAVLAPGEAATVTICGMGGGLIAAILGAGPLGGQERLVLQPMGAEDTIRRWLAAHEWRLVGERLVEDAGRIYVVMAAEPGPMELDDVDEVIGPFVRRSRSPLLARYAGSFLEQARRALEGARRSDREEARERVRQLEQRIAMLEEVIAHADRDHR